MKLKASTLEYRFEDESGYSFDVTAVHDPEFGWSASVSIASHGLVSPETAIAAVVRGAREFIRQADEAGMGKD